jgi:hypothetical protein
MYEYKGLHVARSTLVHSVSLIQQFDMFAHFPISTSLFLHVVLLLVCFFCLTQTSRRALFFRGVIQCG